MKKSTYNNLEQPAQDASMVKLSHRDLRIIDKPENQSDILEKVLSNRLLPNRSRNENPEVK